MCKQVLSSDKGVSTYIDEMEKEGHIYVENWEREYKQLKRMRWIRNRLAHEINVFEEDIVTVQDIEWLRDFRVRILERSDPFALLRQRKCGNDKKYIAIEKETKKGRVDTENGYRENDSKGYMEVAFGIVGVGFFIGIVVSAIIMCMVLYLVFN